MEMEKTAKALPRRVNISTVCKQRDQMLNESEDKWKIKPQNLEPHSLLEEETRSVGKYKWSPTARQALTSS